MAVLQRTPGANGRPTHAAELPPVAPLPPQGKPGPADDAHLLALFAEVARLAGRSDLAHELSRRASPAQSEAPPAPAGPAAPVLSPPFPRSTPEEGQTSLPDSPPPAPPGEAGLLPPAGKAASPADAAHQQGLRLFKAGQFAAAEEQFRQAIRLRPELAEAHANLGVALAQRGRLPEAEAAFRLAVRLSPTGLAAYTNLGLVCLQQRKPAEAEAWLREALQLRPEHAEAHRLLGAALEARNQPGPAEAAYREALRLQPDLADAHFRLGGLLAKKGKAAEAEQCLREAVRLQPGPAAPYNSLGVLLESQGRPAEAEPCYREALRRRPDDPDAHNNLGVALAALARPAEAEACYRAALRLRPKNPVAHSNLGNALRAQGRLAEAEESLRRALALQPKYPEAHNNLGIVLAAAGRVAEGVAEYEEALRLRPDYPEAHLNRSFAWLSAGDFARGWPEYEWRWRGRHLKPPRTALPRWDGRPLAGQTLVLFGEQGAGDTMQFLRYVPRLAETGTVVLAECPPEAAVLAASCPGLSRVVRRGEPAPPGDWHLPLLSLPGVLGTTPDTIPGPVPYFRPDPDRVAYWREELKDLAGLRVGIAWQGSKKHRADQLRSVPLSRFALLASVPGVALCSLQKGPGEEQLREGPGAGLPVRPCPQENFADTAALMRNLDLVICVDTAVAHLAGALGVRVWVALPYAADWRWLRGREDTAWYPSMGLFRQPAPGAWDPVFERLAEALRAETGKARTRPAE